MQRRILFGAPLASFVNYSTREINVKIVYQGIAGSSAAVDAIEYVHENTDPLGRGKLIVLDTGEKTTFFDFSPPSMGEIRGFKTRFHLYATEEPGELVLKGADGVVFVADARALNAQADVDALARLKKSLAKLKYAYETFPLVFQLDAASDRVPSAVLARALDTGTRPVVESNVSDGTGIFDALKAIAKLVLTELKRQNAASPTPTP